MYSSLFSGKKKGGVVERDKAYEDTNLYPVSNEKDGPTHEKHYWDLTPTADAKQRS